VKQVFEKIDTDNSGHIDLDEVCMKLACCSFFSRARMPAGAPGFSCLLAYLVTAADFLRWHAA
jgi:hypothetical protein